MEMRRFLRISLTGIIVTLVVLTTSPWVTARHARHPGAAEAQQATDARQSVPLPAAARDKVLTEMRSMLESINGILQALVTGNMAAGEKAARAAGMASAADVDPQVKQQLPQAFLTLGMQTHKGFDALADEMNARGTKENVIKGLAALTANCVACHSSYRLDEKR